MVVHLSQDLGDADSPRDALGRPVMLLHLVCRCSVSLVVLHCACQTCQACTTWSPAQGEIDVTCNAVSYSERGWPVQANPVGRRSSAVASPEVEVQLSFTKASVRCTAAKSLRECRMLPGVLAAVLASRNEGAPLSSAGNVVTPLRVHRGDSIQRRGDDARGPSSYYWNRLIVLLRGREYTTNSMLVSDGMYAFVVRFSGYIWSVCLFARVHSAIYVAGYISSLGLQAATPTH